VVDFFCYNAMLLIEVDGSVHLDPTQKERDEQQTLLLKQLCIMEIRFANNKVINQTGYIIKRIEAELSNKRR